MKATLGIFIVAVLYFWDMGQYFGWHMKPQSGEEVLADGLLAVIVAVGWLSIKE